MEISFVKMSPTQNVTILVESDIPRSQQAQVAEKLLAYDSVVGEQVGFLEKSKRAAMRLQMMGGEFCGNATMSVGAYLAWKEGIADGECRDYPLEVSGAEGVLVCHVEKNGCYRGTVNMPLPERISEVTLPTDDGEVTLPIVYMPGIAHIISTGSLSKEEIERRIRGWNNVLDADALGVLQYRKEYMMPIVYVRATDTAVWERGCGSGTAALGAWLALQRGESLRTSVAQPGGSIEVSATVEENRVTALSITGSVRVTARGIAYIE